MSRVDPTELRAWLEWASAKLLATPSGKIKPQGPQVIWPEYSQDKFEVMEFRSGLALRVLAPSSEEIPIMDKILLLPNLCIQQDVRKIIRLKSLVDPINNRHLYRWIEIAEKFAMKQYVAKSLFKNGLEEIGRKADTKTVSCVRSFMQN